MKGKEEVPCGVLETGAGAGLFYRLAEREGKHSFYSPATKSVENTTYLPTSLQIMAVMP